MFSCPAFRGNVFAPGKFGGSGRNEAAFPALDTANSNPELLADGFRDSPFSRRSTASVFSEFVNRACR